MEQEIVLRVLGPVRVRTGGGWQAPATAQLRLLTGLLALRAGHVVPVDELIDAIWDDKPPRSARASLQSLVTRLRHLLEQETGAALARCGDGYRLELDSDRVDVGRFRALGRAARSAGGPGAIAPFDAALALWDGPVLADAADSARAKALRQGLDRERMSLVQERLACMLACGRHHEAAAELPAAVARYPLNERLAGLLMVSLYKSGQRADALRAFRQVRSRLAAELGVEPGPELQTLHRRILSGDASLAGETDGPRAARRGEHKRRAGPAAVRPARVVPHQLPAAPAPFVGRAHELGLLDETAGLAGGPDGAPVVWAIVGSAGVGKSTLATYWAHRAVDAFPDGQLYLNLNGFGPAAQPVTPEHAMRRLLRALGVSSAAIPRTLAAQAGLYRSILAGKRVLVVLDNVLDAAQVRALLPGTPGCAAVVTSRVDLDGLVVCAGARVVSLDVLSQAESRELLVRRLGADRARAEPNAVVGLARSCGGLPLALAVVAARAAARPRLKLADLAVELSGQSRLDALETSDEASSVREVLSWSYRQLGPSAARTFRLLSLHPGPDISLAVAASLDGTAPPAAGRALAELTRAHLVSERAPGRFACHDLLRAYAAEQASACLTSDERAAATSRLIDHYLHTAVAAARILYPARDPVELGPPAPGTAPEQVRGRSAALGWFSAEYQALPAVSRAAAAAGGGRAWKLAAAMTDYLDREGHWHDLAALGQVALTAAQRDEDREGQAHAHVALGTACLRFEWHEAAQSHLRGAIALFGGCDSAAREARCHVTIGLALAAQGRYLPARAEAEQALRLYRQLGHRAGEANALGDLVDTYRDTGNQEMARASWQQAIAILDELGDLRADDLRADDLRPRLAGTAGQAPGRT